MRFPWKISINLTPKYLTLSVGKSLLRLNFNFISPSNRFRLDLMIISEILFALSKHNKFFRSKLTSLLSFLIDLSKCNKLVSSAKWCILQNFIAWLRSFMYNKNRRRPRNPEEQHNLFQQAQSHKTIYRNKLFAIRKVGFKPVIWYTKYHSSQSYITVFHDPLYQMLFVSP